MYNMPYFKEKDPLLVREFMMSNPFIILCGCGPEHTAVASHVPVLLEEKAGGLYLRGHIMRQTDHHRAFQDHPEVLAIFTGPHCYVSASWYVEPLQASTWNYMTVHARGRLQFLEEDGLTDLLQKLTARFESSQPSPSFFEHLPEEYIARLRKAIIAFEIRVESLDNVFKLSQNRDQHSFQQIISRLGQGDESSRRIAAEMLSRRERLFPQHGDEQRP
jgi:transcriptional regulator